MNVLVMASLSLALVFAVAALVHQVRRCGEHTNVYFIVCSHTGGPMNRKTPGFVPLILLMILATIVM